MDPEPRPHDFGAKRKKQPSPPVKPPFEVATWKSGGLNLRAFFSAGKPQWIYERVHKQLQSKREGGAFLKDNLDTLKGFFADFGVPSAELGYKHASFQPTPLQPWHDHTVSSRGLVGVLLFQVSLRQVAVAAKQAAIALLHKLAAQLTGISGKPLGLCLEDDDGVHIRGGPHILFARCNPRLVPLPQPQQCSCLYLGKTSIPGMVWPPCDQWGQCIHHSGYIVVFFATLWPTRRRKLLTQLAK